MALVCRPLCLLPLWAASVATTASGATVTAVSAAKPPAWRAIQSKLVPSEFSSRGKLKGAPPCLATLKKVGYGKGAAWHLGMCTLGELTFDVNLKLDANPEVPSSIISFLQRSASPRSIGRVLLACPDSSSSSLRGMEIAKPLRGQGLSRVFLAVWLRLCAEASLTPTTQIINKPLLSRSLTRLGFRPVNGRGTVVSIANAKAGDDDTRTAYVRTTFELPAEASGAQHALLDLALPPGQLVLAAPASAVRKALTLRGGAGRLLRAGDLWARPNALCTLHHPLHVRLATSTLDPGAFRHLVVARRLLLRSLENTVEEACAETVTAAATAGADADGKWVAGRWVRNPLAAAATACTQLSTLMAAEMARADSDHRSWLGESATDGIADLIVESGDEAITELEMHLERARGPLAQLGSCAPILRTVGWVYATLLAADLDAGRGGGGVYMGWIRAHAERWSSLADACDGAYDTVLAALDAGAPGLVVGGALVDVECAVALREAQTSSSLLHEVLDACWYEQPGGEAAVGDGLETDKEDPNHEVLQAAHGSLESLEPGYLHSKAGVVFVRGYGFCDGKRREEVRSNAAKSYTAAARAQAS
jgi:hypothetical protein